MASLHTHYMGLNINNPLIVGSSGLTGSLDEIKKIADHGAGAVVIKSIFEEQIRHEADKFIAKGDNTMPPMMQGYNDILNSRSHDYQEAMDYLTNFAKEHTLNDYLKFISEVKKSVNIPVIASVNCVFTYDWHFFARRIQEAGADAIELNIYVLPSEPTKSGIENEAIYLNVIEAVKKHVTIPVSIKISYYFSGLTQKLIELSNSGIAGMALFNRPYSPDIDIDTFKITAGNIYSSPAEYAHTLRWIAILAGRVGCDIAATTGIHSSEAMIKQLLAGANAVQATSVFYRHGLVYIETMLKGLEEWMKKHNFNTIDDFRGKMSQANIEHPATYERVQFMKLYSHIV